MLPPMIQVAFLIFLFFQLGLSQVIDLRTQQKVDGTWFEVGSSSVSSEWMTITPSYRNFSHPVLFLSTPLSFGQVFPHPLQVRASNILNAGGSVSFQLKLLSANDSFCSKQWWIPEKYSDDLEVSWFVVEEGGFSINGSQIVIGSASISGYVTKVDWEFSFGSSCHYPSQNIDDDYAPAGVFTLQTMNNDATYLSARTTEWWYKSKTNKCSYSWSTGRFFLEPHEGYPLDNRLILNTETLAYLLFDSTPHIIDCLAGSRMEFGSLHGLTDQPSLLPLRSPIDSSSSFIAIYGSVNGYQGGDSFVIRAFYQSETDLIPYVYLQEDQCSDEEMVHLPESAAVVIFSSASNQCPEDPYVTVYSNYPTMAPSDVPSHFPSSLPQPTTRPQSNADSPKKDSNLLLAILLPIIILVIAIVGLFARAYLVNGKGDMIPLSEDSGNDLIFDT